MDLLFRAYFLFLGLLLTLVFGCSSFQKEQDPRVYYKRDVKITWNKKEWRGTATLPKSAEYRLDFESPGKMDLFTISSCHREYQKEDVGYEHDYTYRPVPGLEDGPACPIQISGFDKNKGKHTFGFINFESPELTAKGKLYCNGANWDAVGVSVCQGRSGLIQKIEFEKETKVVSSDECKWTKSSGIVYLFSLYPRECQYLFEEIETGKRFRLDTIGYEDIFIRQD